MAIESAIQKAERALIAYANGHGLEMADTEDGMAVKLTGPMAGHLLTYVPNDGGNCEYYVASDSDPAKSVAEMHSSPGDAVQWATDAWTKRNGTLNGPKPTTTRYPTPEQRRTANAAMTTFAATHNFQKYLHQSHAGDRVIVRPTGELGYIEISWDWDGKISYFARDRNDGGRPANFCASPEDAFGKVVADTDAMNAKQAKLEAATPKPTRRQQVYVCHEYSADPEGNTAKVAAICKGLVADGVLPIAPQVYLAAFVDDATQRELAMGLCLDLLAGCDELLLCGPTLSAGMIDEVRFALARGIPIRSRDA